MWQAGDEVGQARVRSSRCLSHSEAGRGLLNVNFIFCQGGVSMGIFCQIIQGGIKHGNDIYISLLHYYIVKDLGFLDHLASNNAANTHPSTTSRLSEH